MVVTPTLKAAEVAAAETGTDGRSAAWLIHQHGWRWDERRALDPATDPTPDARAPCCDRRPAARRRGRDARPGHRPRPAHHRRRDRRTGRARRRPPPAPRRRPRRRPRPCRTLGTPDRRRRRWTTVHRFADPDYADLEPADAHRRRPGEVFDALLAAARSSSTPPRSSAPPPSPSAGAGRRPGHRRHPRTGRRPQRRDPRPPTATGDTSDDRRSSRPQRGERIGLGDRVATRRNDPDLGVANRQTWTVTGIGDDGSLDPSRPRPRPRAPGRRTPPGSSSSPTPPPSTAPKATPSTSAHVAIGDTTGAASAYVAMTRGREPTSPTSSPRTSTTPGSNGSSLQPRPRRPRTRARTTPGDRRHRPLRPRCRRRPAPTLAPRRSPIRDDSLEPVTASGAACAWCAVARRCRSRLRSGR